MSVRDVSCTVANVVQIDLERKGTSTCGFGGARCIVEEDDAVSAGQRVGANVSSHSDLTFSFLKA